MHYQRLRRTGSLDRYGNRQRSIEQSCETCGASFVAEPNQVKRGHGRFCSYDCKYAADRGVEKVIGTRYVRPDGYVSIKVGIREYALEHRLIAADQLGRPLGPDDQVHHINGVRDDNRPENLEVLTNAEHQRLHDHLGIRTRRSKVTVTCEWCGSESAPLKPSRAATQRFCSNACHLASLTHRRAAEK